jgi:hypothetical protein
MIVRMRFKDDMLDSAFESVEQDLADQIRIGPGDAAAQRARHEDQPEERFRASIAREQYARHRIANHEQQTMLERESFRLALDSIAQSWFFALQKVSQFRNPITMG